MDLRPALLFVFASTFACTRAEPLRAPAEELSQRERILKSVSSVQEYALSQLKEGNHWNYPLYMGIGYTSQYYLFTKWLGIKDSKLDEKKLLNYILDPRYRLKDGSWYQVKDPSLREGHLDSTIMNYWALKVMGPQSGEIEKERQKAMREAIQFINRKGGVLNSTLFAKVVLALFSQISWFDLLPIPVPPGVDPTSDEVQKDFAQWIRPHLIPIVYMRYLRVRKIMKDPNGLRDDRFDLKEIGAPLVGEQEIRESDSDDLAAKLGNWFIRDYQSSVTQYAKKALEKILETQQPRGSWGGYTSATLFALVAIDDHLRRYPEFEAEFNARKRGKRYRTIAQMKAKAQRFISGYYVDNGLSDYLGTVCDGRYWDTILIHRGLIESDNAMTEAERARFSRYPKEVAIQVTEFLLAAQKKSGGIPFGYEFEYAPDVDDTAELVTAYASTVEFLKNRGVDDSQPILARLKAGIQSGLAWILKMQNSDGGWAAFDRDNVGGPHYDLALMDFKDSADLFDDSSEDVTGHVLEAFGRSIPLLREDLKKPLAKEQKDGVQSILNKMDSALGSKIFPKTAYFYLWWTQKWNGDKSQGLGTGGPWFGRWGINYIYGSNAVLVGAGSLLSKKEMTGSLATSNYRSALDWLEIAQNKTDGGFGESIRSYKEKGWIGKGVSTPSQTAWGLAALAAGGRAHKTSAQMAVQYLLDNLVPLKEGGARWIDGAVVGTGHPEIVYLEYPSYPIAFPLIALGEYLRASQE